MMAVTPTRDPAGLVQLIDNNDMDVLGEVQDAPTTYTVLDRLKAIVDGLSAVVISGVSSPSTGGSGRVVLVATGPRQALAAVSTPMTSGVTIMAPAANGADVYIYRNALDTYGYMIAPGGAPLFYEQSDLANISVGGSLGDMIYFIWS